MPFFKFCPKPMYGVLLLTLVGFIILSCQPNENELINQKLLNELETSRVLLPNGWSLTPPKNSRQLGDLPLNLQISPSGRLAAVTNNGMSAQTIMLIDVEHEKLLDQIEIPKSWFGLKFSQDERTLYVSGGNDNMIRVYAIEQDRLSPQDSIVLGAPWPNKIGVAGIELNEPAHQLYAVTEEDSALYIVDLDHHTSQKISLPNEAYTCLLGKERNELYISLWGGRKVAVFNLTTNMVEEFIEVESHPNDMVMTKNGRYLFVANANSNSVSLIDLEKRKVIETIGSALFPDAPAGSTPNGLALSEDEAQLYIANADNNCLAVYDVSEIGQSKSLGFIPTGWYPTSVKVVNHKIFVTNGKGERSLANPKGPHPYKENDPKQYIARLFTGTLSIISIPDDRDLRAYTKAVYTNTPYNKEIEKLADGVEGNPIPRNPDGKSPIKYVFYIIKENRTYDQVFGDISKGNGDPDLCLFPAEITPNHHKLADEFVLFDNFYVDAEVSADGHNWCAGAYATDYVEKSWPTTYGAKGGTWNFYGDGDISLPEKGYIWDYCQRAGVSYRNYGELIYYQKKRAMHKSLEGHYCVDYPRTMTVMDTARFHIWKQDFDSLLAIDQVPRLSTLSLGNDHTMGARLGAPTPKSMLADNDLALGKLVEHISNSRIWAESVIFIVEDDAQNGPDHVDAHRSILLIASPYTKRNFIDHTMYTTSSVLRTMELILGLPPMSQYDAAAAPIYRSFTPIPDMAPYQSLTNSWPLDKINTEKNILSELSEQFNLETEDAAPDIAFNQVIWKTVKGIDSKMPPPRRGAFIRVTGD